MTQGPRKARILRSPRFIPLKYRFIFFTSTLLIVIFGTIGFLLGMQETSNLRHQVERLGLVMAQSLAATCKVNLATYNYVALEQAAEQAAQDPDTVYVIIHDKEGRVAGYSGRPDLQGTLLQDPLSTRAVRATQPLMQTGTWGPQQLPVLDVAVPVSLPGAKARWGTVRVALSLQPMYRRILQIQLTVAGIGLSAVVLGIWLSIWLAGRITRPLGHLVEATIEAAQGNLEQRIEVRTGDEVEVLAQNFSTMIREVLTQRQQLESQLLEIRRLQRYTEKLLTTMSDGLLSVDRQGYVAAINPAASRMLGVSAEQCEGVPVAAVLTRAPGVLSYVRDLLQNPHLEKQQEIHINGQAELQVVLAGSSVLTDSSGKPLEIIVNLHDITQLKKLEARIRQTERLAALGTLAAGMAHEIRNPLSAIKTFVQLLPRKLEKPGFLDKFQHTVPRELERINRLIGDLLVLAREPKYQFAVTEVKLLLRQSLELLEEELNVRNIVCQTSFCAAPLNAWGDADQLSKAFLNLVRNAIQAMPSGGHLLVAAQWEKGNPLADKFPSPANGWALIQFQDTGSGIPAEDMQQIFNPFFTTKDTGTGLGLAITHKVITEHGGHIEASSQVGVGTCFTIYLPAADAFRE